jgi:Eukaryotic mitochondrial regulator protein
MLPTTPLVDPSLRPQIHEPINDLPVHPATTQQIFEPTSESRVFTRIDASKAFDPTILPADERIPHPELVVLERERISGLSQEERLARQQERAKKEVEKRKENDRRREEIEAATLKKVLPSELGGNGGRWEWRFREICVQDAGKDGRAPGGVGWRYGIPHEDRKKGQIKIPTKV